MAKYSELVGWMQNKIRNGELHPGDKFYSENTLCVKFGISRQTVRHAMKILEEEGLIKRVRGSGTFIGGNVFEARNKKRVAVVTTYVDGYIFPRMIRKVEGLLFDNGYSVQIGFTNNQVGREREILKDILEKDEVGGIILEPTQSGLPNPNREYLEEIRRRRIPIIFVNSYYPETDVPYVSLNDRLAGERITEYLIEQGHRKIGGIFKLDDGQGHRRYSGYLEAMGKHGMDTDEERIVWMDTKDFRNLALSGERILQCAEQCTALVCYNDEFAFAVAGLLKKNGIQVPEEVSVVGFDDSELAARGEVRLTSVSNPIEEVGERAVINLLRMLKDCHFSESCELEGRIIIRDSVKTIRQTV